MRSVFLLIAALSMSALAQQTTTFTTDINGRRLVDGVSTSTTSGNATTRTELTQSINGRQVPLESVEERVVSDDANGRVVERIVRRYDATGNPGPVEKQQVQERKNADGSQSTVTTVHRGDINGGYTLVERVISEGVKSGNTTNANVSVERPTVNGRLEVVERQVKIATAEQNVSKTDVTTFRKDTQGRFVEALRQVSDSSEQNGERVENTAQYEPGENGRLKLASQQVSHVRKHPDGTESRQVDIFRNVPGRAESSTTPRLEERQIVEQRKAGGQLIETTSVQRPTVSDPNRLGSAMKIGERVCSGSNCK